MFQGFHICLLSCGHFSIVAFVRWSDKPCEETICTRNVLSRAHKNAYTFRSTDPKSSVFAMKSSNSSKFLSIKTNNMAFNRLQLKHFQTLKLIY